MSDDRERKGLENQIKGAGKEFKGKVRGSVGDLSDDRSEQIKGKAEELKGKVQRKIGERQSDVDRDF